MKERPILFSAPMVRAILEGRKTQTRRVVKPQMASRILDFKGEESESSLAFKFCSLITWDEEDLPPIHDQWAVYHKEYSERGVEAIGNPYGKPGDRLWVRETWAVGSPFDHIAPGKLWSGDDLSSLAVEYLAGKRVWGEEGKGGRGKWRPSIHMPRWASRILLEVRDVKVERLQEISTEDIVAEGLHDGTFNPAMGKRWHNGMQLKWIELWDSINAARGAGWNKNPWVWAITFRRIEIGKPS